MPPDPDALPGQTTNAETTPLSKIREAAQTKKAVLQVQQLEKKIKAEEQPDPPKEDHKLPPPPQRTLSIEQLLVYWNGIKPAIRPRLLGYLYRLWPIISRTPAYIDKLAEPPADVTAFLRQWGTGEYELMLTDLDKPKGGQLCKARFKFSQSYDEFPPVLDAIDLDVGRKENASYITWARSKGLLKMPGEQTPNGNDAATAALAAGFQQLLAKLGTQKPDGGGQEALYKSMADMFKDANKSSIEMVLAQAKQNDPQALLTLFTGLQTLLAPKAAASDDSLTKFLFHELSEERKANRDLMTKLLETKQPGGGHGGLNQVKEMVDLIAGLKDVFGGPGGGSGQWYDMFAPHIGEFVTTLGKFGDAIKFSAQRGAPPAAPAANPGLVPGAPPDPMAQPGGAPPPQPNPQQQGATMPLELQNFFQQAATPFMTFLRNGQRGDDLAAYLFDGAILDALNFSQIKAIGRDKILEMLKASPAWPVLAGAEARLIEFLDEFLAFNPQDTDADVEAPPPPKGTPVQ